MNKAPLKIDDKVKQLGQKYRTVVIGIVEANKAAEYVELGC